MKTTIKILSAFVLTFCFFGASAQYKSAAGVRFTDRSVLGTYKLNMNDQLSVEGMAGFPTINGVSGLIIGGEFQMNTEISEVPNLSWFYGAGANIFIGDGGSGTFAYGAGGLDYYFEEIPLNLSFEIMPGFNFGGGDSDFEIDFALSARYILGN